MASKNETTSEDEKNAEGEGGENPLKKIYFAVEDQYYAAKDFLDQKLRIPVYKFFVEPIEVNGVPSFPFAVLMLMMLAISAAWLLMAPQTADVSISLKSASTGGAVGGAQVTLLIDGSEFGQATSGDDGTASFGGVPLGKPASVIVKADNFKTY